MLKNLLSLLSLFVVVCSLAACGKMKVCADAKSPEQCGNSELFEGDLKCEWVKVGYDKNKNDGECVKVKY